MALYIPKKKPEDTRPKWLQNMAKVERRGREDVSDFMAV